MNKWCFDGTWGWRWFEKVWHNPVPPDLHKHDLNPQKSFCATSEQMLWVHTQIELMTNSSSCKMMFYIVDFWKTVLEDPFAQNIRYSSCGLEQKHREEACFWRKLTKKLYSDDRFEQKESRWSMLWLQFQGKLFTVLLVLLISAKNRESPWPAAASETRKHDALASCKKPLRSIWIQSARGFFCTHHICKKPRLHSIKLKPTVFHR